MRVITYFIHWQTLSPSSSHPLKTASLGTRTLYLSVYENKEWQTRELMISINTIPITDAMPALSSPSRPKLMDEPQSIYSGKTTESISGANLTELRSGFFFKQESRHICNNHILRCCLATRYKNDIQCQ